MYGIFFFFKLRKCQLFIFVRIYDWKYIIIFIQTNNNITKHHFLIVISDLGHIINIVTKSILRDTINHYKFSGNYEIWEYSLRKFSEF